MKKRQINGYEAGKRVQGLWATSASDLDGIEEMAPEKIRLDVALLQVESASAVQSEDTSGNAALKENLKQIMVSTVLKYALRARVKAHQAHNVPLELELSHPITYYSRAEAEEALSLATATKTKIKNNMAVLTNIIDDNITEMDKAIANFEAIISVPKADKQTQKVAGTDQIAPLIVELDTVIVNIGDLIHSYFPDSILSQEFDAKSKIGSTVSRHNHVIFHVEIVDSNVPIAAAKATNVKTNKTVAADGDGMIEFETVRAGKQGFVIEAEGYVAKTVYVIVTRSTTTELVVQLEGV
jgi:hypothetical protein